MTEKLPYVAACLVLLAALTIALAGKRVSAEDSKPSADCSASRPVKPQPAVAFCGDDDPLARGGKL